MMRLDTRAANSLASVLPSCRVALVFGGALLFAESVVLATTMFAAACLSFVASLAVATKIYRVRAPRPIDREGGASGSDGRVRSDVKVAAVTGGPQ
jgi:hypothetical protein